MQLLALCPAHSTLLSLRLALNHHSVSLYVEHLEPQHCITAMPLSVVVVALQNAAAAEAALDDREEEGQLYPEESLATSAFMGMPLPPAGFGAY